MKGEPEVDLARQIDKASAELAGSMSELVRPALAWRLVAALVLRGHGSDPRVLRLVADRLRRLTQLTEDQLVDLREDPDDVIDRVAGHYEPNAGPPAAVSSGTSTRRPLMVGTMCTFARAA